MPRRRFDEDSYGDEYLSMRYPSMFNPFYTEVYPDDGLDERGFRRPMIGPVKRGPKEASIGPAKPKPPVREPESWLDRLGGMFGRGYPDTPVPTQQRRQPTIGPVAAQPLGRRLPAGDYQDTSTPQTIPSRIGPARSGPQDSRGILTSRSSPVPVAPNQTAAMYGGRNPFATAMTNARANSTGAAGTPMPPSPYGEGMERIPNAFRIAMENARRNSNQNVRPPVFQAQGVTNPNSVVHRQDADYDIATRFRPQDYAGATRVAAAARPPRLAPRGIPSGVPQGPPPGGIMAPPSSPIQSVGGTNGSPYESPIGESGWMQRMPRPFIGQEGPAGPGAFNRFDITQEGGRNAGAEGNLPIQQVQGQGSASENPYLEGQTSYNWKPIEAYNEYLAREPARGDYQPKGWGRILNAATAGLHGYRTGDVGEGIALGEQLNQRPYQRAVEDWKRKGTGLARAAELEDKRYNVAVQDENRRADNYRQQQELDLRRMQHILADERFRHEVGQDNYKRLTEGWKPQIGPNGTMLMIRMGPNGLEQYETDVPNDKLTAAQELAEAKLNRQSAERRTQTSANATLGAARIGAQSRAAEGAADRAHESTENVLGRAYGVQRENARRGTTGGSDFTSPERLLSSPDYKEIEQSQLIKIYKNADGEYEVEYPTADPAALEKKLEELSGGDPNKFRRLSDRYRQFQEYMTRYGGQ